VKILLPVQLKRTTARILSIQPASGKKYKKRHLQEHSASWAETNNPTSSDHASREQHFNHDFSKVPSGNAFPKGVQPKLVVGQPDDLYEKEADDIADRIMHMAEPGVSSAGNVENLSEITGKKSPLPTIQSQFREEMVLRSAPEKDGEVTPQFDTGLESLMSGGQPLSRSIRAFFEPRFGYDFSRVRVHSDARGAESARAVNARAYTVGNRIVFGPGEYAPATPIGQRLIAHELVHVVQQTTAPAVPFHLQRAPDKKQKRQDVVLLGEDMKNGEELARLLSPTGRIFPVKNLGEAAAVLAKIDFPVGTLYFVAHSAPNGAVQFGSKEGVIEPADIASKLKSQVSADNAPEAVDFRGCSVGTSPKAMNQIRAALGAKSVVAGTCFTIIDRSTPILIGDKDPKQPITRKSDVTDRNRKTFENLREKTAKKFGEKKKCILNPSEDGFFAAGGQFVLLWFNPDETTDWIPGKSVCYNEIALETVDPDKALSESQHCRLIRVETKSVSKD
jgi:hypothetical protein